LVGGFGFLTAITIWQINVFRYVWSVNFGKVLHAGSVVAGFRQRPGLRKKNALRVSGKK